jgi:hypothetical protein
MFGMTSTEVSVSMFRGVIVSLAAFTMYRSKTAGLWVERNEILHIVFNWKKKIAGWD